MHLIKIDDINIDGLDEYKLRYLKNISPSNYLLEALEDSFKNVMNGLGPIDEPISEYAYQQGKWSIKEILLHICDTERVFQYRSLCLARDRSMTLTPFDENVFAENSNASTRTFESILNEFKHIHISGQTLFQSFNEEQCLSNGNFNGQQVNAALFGFLIAGHRLHHLDIINTRYLSSIKGV